MLSWLSMNIGTVIVCAVLLLIVGAIIFSMIRKKKAGRSSCSCACCNCPMNGSCHKN